MSARWTMGVSWLIPALLLVSNVPALAASLDLDAPGGIVREANGAIKASGAPGRPLVATIGDYQLTAGELHYDPRSQTGLAAGNVIWRERRAQEAAEIRTDRLHFAMTARKLTAEGRVALTDRGLTVSADALQGDLAAEIYQADGSPARVVMKDRQEIRAKRLVYERTAEHLTAEGGVVLLDGDLTLAADRAQGDLEEQIYQVFGSPAQAVMDGRSIEAGSLLYERERTLLEARDGVSWVDRTGGEPRLLTAAFLSYNRTEDIAAAGGGVTLTAGGYKAAAADLHYRGQAGTYTLSGSAAVSGDAGEFSAQRLVWHPAAGWIEAIGEARFHDDVFAGQCEELRYTAEENRVYLKGSVKLTRGQDSLTGREIVCDLTTRQVWVTGEARATLVTDSGEEG